MEKTVCGAETKRTGNPCQKRALANGRCKLHGGKSTGPKDKEKHRESLKGNKNAVKTHQYETLWAEQFTGKYKELFEVAPIDALEVVELELRKNEVRQMKMHDRIEQLKSSKGKVKIETITRLEEAFTSVQAQKIRLAEIKAKLEGNVNEENEGGALHELNSILGQIRNKRLGL